MIGRTRSLARHGSPAPAPAAGDPVSTLVRMTSTAPRSAAGTAAPADRGSGTARPSGPAAVAPVLAGGHRQVDVALSTGTATTTVGEAAPVPEGGRRQSPGSSPAMKALRGASPLALAGMLATAANVGVTLLIARMLTTRGYGALAQLIALFFVLSMPGSALLVGVVRRVTAWRRVSRLDLVADWVRATRRRALVLVILFSLLAIALRGVIAEWMNLPSPAGVAETLSAGAVWGLLSLDRGLLQAGHAYPPLGRNLIVEGLSRCLLTVALVAVGLGVQGATLAILLSVIFADLDARRSLTALDLYDPTRIPADPGPAAGDPAAGDPVVAPAPPAAGEPTPDAGAMRAVVAHSEAVHSNDAHSRRSLTVDVGTALAALALLGVLQNIDVVLLGRAEPSNAGAYAAISVATKLLVLAALVLSSFLLPEAAARRHLGEHALHQLGATLTILAIPAALLLTVSFFAPRQLLGVAFGGRLTAAAPAFATLAAAMSCLAMTVLFTHYLLAVGRRRIVFLLLAGAAVATVLIASRHGAPVATARADLITQAGLAAVTGASVLHVTRKSVRVS